MPEELKDVWLGKELERLIDQGEQEDQGRVVNVEEVVIVDEDGKETVSFKAGVGSVESGTTALVGDAD